MSTILRQQIETMMNNHRDILSQDFQNRIIMYALSASFFRAIGKHDREEKELRECWEVVNKEIFGI